MAEKPKIGENRGNAGNGRPKGAENKVTRAVKEAVQAAFDEVGGVDYLVTVAKEDHKTFCALLGKVIPTQVNAEIGGANGGPMKIVVEVMRDAGSDK